MLKFLLKRLLWLIPVILGVSILVFTLMYLTPGDPVKIILGSNATDEQIAALTQQLGLDQPYLVQLGRFLRDTFLRLDLGTSYRTHREVLSEVMARLPYTLRIAVISMGMAILIGLPLGVIAATNQYSWKDNLSIFSSLFCVSMPSFWFSLIMVMLFSLRLRILPPLGIDSWKCYIMPCLSIAVGGAANVARQTRSSMLEVIRQDYVTTARAKGQKERLVIYGDALQNALIPVITVIGGQFANMMGGSIIAEVVFSIPGVGSYMLDAISFRDYPAVRGGVLIISLCFCLIILAVDILYAFVDPRIRAQYES